MKRLINITGLPGSGKSTLALLLAQELDGCAFAADDYFNVFNPYLMRTDYVFDPKRLTQAHEGCQEQVKDYLDSFHDGGTAIVHNTGRTRAERQTYRDIASSCGAEYTEIYVSTNLTDAELAARNVHKVPESTIARMRKTWEI
jgi:adenylylsulfate kinase-like enzyme